MKNDIILSCKAFRVCWIPVEEPMEGTLVQQVLKVALLFLVLERRILLSSRKGAWHRVRKGLVSLEVGRTIPTRDF
jgi:hypothetical protein